MRTLTKICGVRRIKDAALACTLGADAIGFVFWPGSPRFIDPERARASVSELPPFVAVVGVFVDQTPDYVAGVASSLLFLLYRPGEVERERKAKGPCIRCGYNLTGNVSGVCPECGEAVTLPSGPLRDA